MRFFGGSSQFKIPTSVDQPRAPLDLLYCAIFACLKSHVKDIDPSAELELGMYIGNERLEILAPMRCGEVAIKAAKECYILKHLNWKFQVLIDDKKFDTLKGGSV